ncbi:MULTISPECIES: lipoprotein [Actinoplanes]|uniref:lipoprotein n=1 Tax=Actinoplanes TaxID=1865 RepID=UPI0005F28F8D|nr:MULTISPECIES: lipoprotein [Actinoplanes]GLY06908.1 hypothetical protein Acsp01_72870 [Actinoplanes sp. NBRC 101535]
MRSRISVLVATSAILLSACSGNSSTETAPDPAVSSVAPAAAGAAEAGRVGEAGSDCPMPISVGLAEGYTAKAVVLSEDDELAALARRGTLTMVCEIDAKPAGNIGYLRVYTGKGTDLKTTLTAFIGEKALTPAFTELTIGGQPAIEAVYTEKSQLDDTIEPERAFVVKAGDGITAVSLESLDGDEHQAMLPAYELAKSALKLTA